jgi:hypothetical protein
MWMVMTVCNAAIHILCCCYLQDPETTGLYPRVGPNHVPLLAGMQPHIVLSYANDAHLVHRGNKLRAFPLVICKSVCCWS